MGNRAVIRTENRDVGVYVHWNGGKTSVECFLKYCKMKGYRPPEEDEYGWARLCQVIANFMGPEGLSVGMGKLENLDCDNWDNGTYIMRNWELVGHEFSDPGEDDYNPEELLLAIDMAQPEDHRLGRELLLELYHDGTSLMDVCNDFLVDYNGEYWGSKPHNFEVGKWYRAYSKTGRIEVKLDRIENDRMAYFTDENGKEMHSLIYHSPKGRECAYDGTYRIIPLTDTL